jgi:drug/metabolite transporter (DMT)-like permease
MLTGSIILGKRFAPTEYCAALLAMAGLYLFSVADMVSVSDRTDSIKGIGLMLLAVGSEATVSNMQVLFL